MSIPFKETMTFNERYAHSSSIRAKYPNSFPVILEKSTRDKILTPLTKIKYLMPAGITIIDCLQILRKRLKLNQYLSVNIYCSDHNIILSGSNSIEYLYKEYANEDGFLYLEYCGANTFGCN